MGVEFLLLFGLGITGVVLTNLLTGETITEARPVGGSGSADIGSAAPDGAPAAEEPRPTTEGGGPVAESESESEIATLPHERPHLWGHPAPLARLLALIAVSAILLTSAIWGLGWFAAQAISRSLGG